MQQTRPIFISIVVIILAVAGTFFLINKSNKSTKPKEPVASASLSAIPSANLAQVIARPASYPEDFVEYTNTQYGFQFFRAPGAVVKEYDEGGGAMTIVIEDKDSVRGFQIFILPYAVATISEGRFLADVPSGVRENVEPMKIGTPSVEAVTFTSYDQFLGDMREIWFIYKGHLYEISTLKGMEDWLAPIIQSWSFL